jgi:hypothetical protein
VAQRQRLGRRGLFFRGVWACSSGLRRMVARDVLRVLFCATTAVWWHYVVS